MACNSDSVLANELSEGNCGNSTPLSSMTSSVSWYFHPDLRYSCGKGCNSPPKGGEGGREEDAPIADPLLAIGLRPYSYLYMYLEFVPTISHALFLSLSQRRLGAGMKAS